MEELSPRQREILELIREAVRHHGVVPTYREIGARLGIGSTNAVSDHLRALMRKGYLEQFVGAGKPRSLRLTEKAGGPPTAARDTVQIPLLGRVAAGVPILAVEQHDNAFAIDAELLPTGNLFGLVIRGDSMIDDGIHDGDYVIVRQQNNAHDGEIAVVMVDQEATVKRLFRDGPILRLEPANKTMSTIVVDTRQQEAQVLGLVVGLYRRVH